MVTPPTPQLYVSKGRTAFVGHVPAETFTNRAFAHALFVSLDGETELSQDGSKESLVGTSFLIPASHWMTFAPRGKTIAAIYLDPVKQDLTRLKTAMKRSKQIGTTQVWEGLPFEEVFIEHARDILYSPRRVEELFSLIDTWLSKQPKENKLIDPRVEDVLTQIRHTYDQKVSVLDLASSVGLSEPRLIQLFKQNVGVPIRSYRVWCRFTIAVVMIGLGHSMADAAIFTGFTDSAQFSKQFKRIIGMSPSEVLGSSAEIEIRVSEELHSFEF